MQTSFSVAAGVLALCLGAAPASAQTAANSNGGPYNGATDNHHYNGTTSDNPSNGQSHGNNADSDSNDRTALSSGERSFLNQAAQDGQKGLALSELAAQRASRSEVRDYAQKVVSDHEQLNADLRQLAQRKGVTLASMGGTDAMDTTPGMVGASSTVSNQTEGLNGPSTTRPTTNGTVNQNSTSGVPARDTSDRGPTKYGTSDRAGTMTSEELHNGNNAAATGMGSMAMTSDPQYQQLSGQSGRQFDRDYLNLIVSAEQSAVSTFQNEANEASDPDIKAFASQHLDRQRGDLNRAQSLQSNTSG